MNTKSIHKSTSACLWPRDGNLGTPVLKPQSSLGEAVPIFISHFLEWPPRSLHPLHILGGYFQDPINLRWMECHPAPPPLLLPLDSTLPVTFMCLLAYLPRIMVSLSCQGLPSAQWYLVSIWMPSNTWTLHHFSHPFPGTCTGTVSPIEIQSSIA